MKPGTKGMNEELRKGLSAIQSDEKAKL